MRKEIGFEVLTAIRIEQPAPAVLVLTNHFHVRYRKKCLVDGADDFTDKTTHRV